MSQARVHPPSEQRIREARRAGHVPRVPLVSLAASWIALACGLFLLGDGLGTALERAFVRPLEALAAGRPLALPVAELERVAVSLLALLALAWVALAASIVLAQGPAFGAVPARPRFPELRAGRTARALFVLGLPVLGAFALERALRASERTFVDVLFTFAILVGVLAFACALIDVAFARAAHVRSLWLTRAEHRDEQREAYGSPEARAAREGARRERAGAP